MEDVILSLQDMELSHEGPSQQQPRSSTYPWSPETMEQSFKEPRSRRTARPRSSLGIAGADEEQRYGYDSYRNNELDGSGQTYFDGSRAGQAVRFGPVDSVDSRQERTEPSSHYAPDELFFSTASEADTFSGMPGPRPTSSSYHSRPHSSIGRQGPGKRGTDSERSLKKRKSAYDVGRDVLSRTFTTKSTTTTTSSGVQSASTDWSANTQITSQSIMSGRSAGGFSATSAGSLARKRQPDGFPGDRPASALRAGRKELFDSGDGTSVYVDGRPNTPRTGVTYHSSNDPRGCADEKSDHTGAVTSSPSLLGVAMGPKAKKSGFFKKMIESAKTGAASARSSIAAGQPTPPHSPLKNLRPNGVTSIAGGSQLKTAGAGGTSIDWVQVRRDVNRSNSLSINEKVERQERCQMMDYPVIRPIDALYEFAEGDEAADGMAVAEPTDFQTINFNLVDKGARFINSLPPMTNPTSLAQSYVCRPHRSDAQRLRAVFIWVSEKIAWEEDFEGQVEARRVIQTRKGCAEEVAVLVMEMCSAVGIHAEVVRGYLKVPGECLELNSVPHPNHWWNAVLVEGEWRIMDCSLASPTNPKRGQYSNAGSQSAETWWYLARPMEMCYTHVPLIPEQQHICPTLPYDVLLALPCACPPYFKDRLQLMDFDTSQTRIEELEQVHLQVSVPPSVECFAEVEAKAFERDVDGDFFESGEVVRKKALVQADWSRGEKRYTVKALLPGDEGHGVIKVYAGKRGLMVTSIYL